MKRFGLALFGLGLLLSSLPSCEQWVSTACLKDTEATQETEQPVTMSAVTAADYLGTLPLASISCPDAGEDIKAEHIREPVAAFLAECDDIRTGAGGLDEKYDKVGGLITGLVTITPTGSTGALLATAGVGSGQPAITAMGDLNFPGIVTDSATGSGLVSFAKVEITAKAGQNGLDVSLTTAPSATVPQVGTKNTGLLRMTGTPPNADVDPGFDSTMSTQSMVTSSAILESDGVGGFTVRNNKGFNVLSWSGSAVGVVTVNFKRNLPGSDYRISILGETGYEWGWNGVQNVGNYQFILKNSTTKATINLLTTVVTLHVSTIGF